MNAQELKAKLIEKDIIHIVKTLGSDIKHTTEEYFIFKTVCHHGNSDKLFYYRESKMFHCFTDCGDSFDVLELVCRSKNIKFHEAIQYVCILLGISTVKEGFTNETIELINDWDFINGYRRKSKTKLKDKEFKDFYDTEILNIFQNIYTDDWKREGISEKVMQEFNIRYCTLKQSIIIPHYNINNNLMGIRQRAMLEEDVLQWGKYTPFQLYKTIYSHPISQNLYGIHKNKNTIKTKRKVMLVESEKGVLQCSTLFGVDNNFTLALCGKTLSNFQRDLILSLGVDECIIALDKQYKTLDSEECRLWAKYVREKIIAKLAPYMKVYVIWDTEDLLQYKDSPTDRGSEVLLKLMKNKLYVGTY